MSLDQPLLNDREELELSSRSSTVGAGLRRRRPDSSGLGAGAALYRSYTERNRSNSISNQ